MHVCIIDKLCTLLKCRFCLLCGSCTSYYTKKYKLHYMNALFVIAHYQSAAVCRCELHYMNALFVIAHYQSAAVCNRCACMWSDPKMLWIVVSLCLLTFSHSGNLLISLYTNHRVKLLICLSTESLTVSVDTPTNTSLVVVEFGDTVSIDCIASTTGVDIDYEWMKVNNLTTGDSVIVSTNQTLFVSFLTSSEEAGYYYCRATISPTLMDVFNVSEVVLVIFAPTFVMQ